MKIAIGVVAVFVTFLMVTARADYSSSEKLAIELVQSSGNQGVQEFVLLNKRKGFQVVVYSPSDSTYYDIDGFPVSFLGLEEMLASPEVTELSVFSRSGGTWVKNHEMTKSSLCKKWDSLKIIYNQQREKTVDAIVTGIENMECTADHLGRPPVVDEKEAAQKSIREFLKKNPNTIQSQIFYLKYKDKTLPFFAVSDINLGTTDIYPTNVPNIADSAIFDVGYPIAPEILRPYDDALGCGMEITLVPLENSTVN
jgi:hypothetical protein